MMYEIVLLALKFSFSISVLVIFYKIALSHLTFFKMIRWYFLIGVCLSFLISIIHVSIPPVNPSTITMTQKIANQIPSIGMLTSKYTVPKPETAMDFNSILMYTWWIGVVLFMVRLGIQFISFLRLKRNSSLLIHDSFKIYLIKEEVSPFSFADAIYIHSKEWDDPDAEKIIEHEKIHIRQGHSMDMILAEFVCILNWFNPLAWVLKKSIRQNLEYLTDDIMLDKGIDRKAYQYILLRALGQGAFRFTTTFNIHSLKSRIIMINNSKSNPIQQFRFLLILPAMLFILLAFRSEHSVQDLLANTKKAFTPVPAFPDQLKTATEYLSNADTTPKKKGSTQSTANGKHEISISRSLDDDPKVKRITIQGNTAKGDIATVYLRDGNKEVYDLNDIKAKDAFEDKYGYINMMQPPMPPTPPMPPMPAMAPMAPMPPMTPMAPMPPMPPMTPMAPMPPMPPMTPMAPMPPMPPSFGFGFELPADVTEISQSTESIKLTFKNGKIESYDLNDPVQKKQFREKYVNHNLNHNEN